MRTAAIKQADTQGVGEVPVHTKTVDAEPVDVTDLPAGPRHARPSDGWAARRAANRRAAGGDTASEKGQDPRAATGRDGEPALSGRGGRGSGAMTIDPRDRAQLADAPVPMSRVVALFRPHRVRISVVCALIVATSIVSMAQPFLVRAVVDVALPTRDVQMLALLVSGMVGVAAATQILGVVQTWLSTEVGQRVMHELRTSIFVHLQRQSLGFFTRTRAGEVQSRLTNDVNGMQSVVTTTATSIAANLTTAIATFVAMFALSWRLSLLSLLVIPPALWLTRRVALVRRSIKAAQQRHLPAGAVHFQRLPAELRVCRRAGPLAGKGIAHGHHRTQQHGNAQNDTNDPQQKSFHGYVLLLQSRIPALGSPARGAGRAGAGNERLISNQCGV